MPVDGSSASRNTGLWMDVDNTEMREDEDEREFVCVAVDESGCTCSFLDSNRSIKCGKYCGFATNGNAGGQRFDGFRPSITGRPTTDCEYSRRTPASCAKSKHFAYRNSRFPRGRAGFRLSPHQSIRGSSPELSALKFRPGSDGLELTSDNSVSSLMLGSVNRSERLLFRTEWRHSGERVHLS